MAYGKLVGILRATKTLVRLTVQLIDPVPKGWKGKVVKALRFLTRKKPDSPADREQ